MRNKRENMSAADAKKEQRNPKHTQAAAEPHWFFNRKPFASLLGSSSLRLARAHHSIPDSREQFPWNLTEKNIIKLIISLRIQPLHSSSSGGSGSSRHWYEWYVQHRCICQNTPTSHWHSRVCCDVPCHKCVQLPSIACDTYSHWRFACMAVWITYDSVAARTHTRARIQCDTEKE